MAKRICLLLCGLSLSLQAAGLSVIAIEYPPFTSSQEEHRGLAFLFLIEALAGSSIVIEPRFFSPARAHKRVQEGVWCGSFYPPQRPEAQHKRVFLDDKSVRLGLYRRREPGPFIWQALSDLKGKRVAHLRALARDGIGLELQQSGVELFNTETFAQGLQLLKKGRVDYAFGDPVSGALLMEQLGMNADAFQFSDSVFRADPVHIWLNLRCSSAREAFAYLTGQ